MKRSLTKSAIASTVTGIALITLLTGCAGLLPTMPTEPPAQTEAAEEPQEDDTTSSPASGEVLAPGGEVQGDAALLPWISHDDAESVFAHTVTAIEEAPEADVAQIAESEPTITDFDVWYITVDSQYVSGDVTAHSAFYTEFDPIRADGTELQSIALIGYDSCPSTSVSDPGTDPEEIVTNCITAATPKGSEKPAGVSWAQYDTDYASYDGDPARILM